MPDDAWRERLKAEVPRGSIPAFLTDLQALVSLLRRYRDNLQVPDVAVVREGLTPLLRAHPALVVSYLGDVRYARVVEDALGS